MSVTVWKDWKFFYDRVVIKLKRFRKGKFNTYSIFLYKEHLEKSQQKNR